MKVDWKEIWNVNPDSFIVSGWDECAEEKKKGWRLPLQFSYFSAGDVNLRVGIIASDGNYREEDLLLGGILWAKRLGNGVRTVIYFVAQEFSPAFLQVMRKLGGQLSAKAVYWREKLTPSLYPVQEKDVYQVSINGKMEKRPAWDLWAKQLNPVAGNHLMIIKKYFDALAGRRVRTVLENERIRFFWGKIQIAEIQKKGNRFELATKIKWTKNKIISGKLSKSGWVDISGTINEEFQRAVNGILNLLEKTEADGMLGDRELLALKLIHDKEFRNLFGTYFEFPLCNKSKREPPDFDEAFFFTKENRITVIRPILEKPAVKVVQAFLFSAYLESILNEEALSGLAPEWTQRIVLLCLPEIAEELRLCQSFFKQPEEFPVLVLSEDWKEAGGVREE